MKTDPKSGPLRRCRPLREWPDLDQQLWAAALTQGGLLQSDGRAAHWRPDTQRKVVASYGRFLTFLDRHGDLDPARSPAERLTEVNLLAYIAELQAQVAPVTVAQRLTDLGEALRVMQPGGDHSRLRQVAARLWRRARPSRKGPERLLLPDELFGLARRLIAQASGPEPNREQGRLLRDGLILAILASRQIRLGNLRAMRIDRHLVREGSGYRLAFTGEETKNHQSLERRLPAELTPALDLYLERVRPQFLGQNQSLQVWIAMQGTEMTANSIYSLVRAHTLAAFGTALNPHAFRHMAATAVALRDPAHVGIGLRLLGHSNPRSFERHYNLAKANEAAEAWQQALGERRRQARRSTRDSGRRS